MRILLLSTYELGHQPFGLASPAAWLRESGHEVTCADLAVSPLPETLAESVQMVAFYLPMHTATRLAAPVIKRVATINPAAHIACYGLYAPLHAEYLRGLGARSIVGGEFEQELVDLAAKLKEGASVAAPPKLVTLDRLTFRVPDRAGLPPLARYASLIDNGEHRTAGYTEASRGCRHLCRHCPVVPVYKGQFRVVARDVVLADIRQQVDAGATHITFGDPDFFNGPTHAARIVEALHQDFPRLTYDVTIKIEHLLAHRSLLGVLKRTGCLFITSAVESLDDRVLALLEKGHTKADFLEAVSLCGSHELALAPTFIPFTPWTTLAGYLDLLATLASLDLVESVGSVQLALRLLIPPGSRLLELEDVLKFVEGFDQNALVWRWHHPDSSLDDLASNLLRLVDRKQRAGHSRTDIFAAVWQEAGAAHPGPAPRGLLPRAAVPYLNEPWYC